MPFKIRGMMQVMTQNGPMVIDKMVVDVSARAAARPYPRARARTHTDRRAPLPAPPWRATSLSCCCPPPPQIAQACATLNIPGAIEPKTYPRDIMCRGRVRVRIFDEETGKPLHEGITNRRQLLLKLGEQIKINLAKAPPPQQQIPQKKQAAAAPASGNKKKSSKKKKK